LADCGVGPDGGRLLEAAVGRNIFVAHIGGLGRAAGGIEGVLKRNRGVLLARKEVVWCFSFVSAFFFSLVSFFFIGVFCFLLQFCFAFLCSFISRFTSLYLIVPNSFAEFPSLPQCFRAAVVLLGLKRYNRSADMGVR
jgi:hypothetical protein